MISSHQRSDEHDAPEGVRHTAHDQHAGYGEHQEHGSHGSHSGGGHDKHAGHRPAMFRDRFWLSLLLTLPVVFWAESIQMWFGYTAPEFPGSGLLQPVLGTLIFLYGGWPFVKGAISEARSRAPGMLLLIGMAITVAYLSSLTASLGLFDVEVWWELSLLIVIMLLGHWMEMRAIGQDQGALAALAELLPDEAERVTDGGQVETVKVGDLTVGDVVLVRPGARGPPTAPSSRAPRTWTCRCSPANPSRSRAPTATGWWPPAWPPTARSGCGWTP